MTSKPVSPTPLAAIGCQEYRRQKLRQRMVGAHDDCIDAAESSATHEPMHTTCMHLAAVIEEGFAVLLGH